MRAFTLYWSSLKKYEECPQAFLWGRGWGNIDCGGGPGRRKPVPFISSRHHAVMGIVIANVLERLYNDELWRDPVGLADRLEALVDTEWARVTAKSRNFVDYRVAGSAYELKKICKDGVRGYLRTMKAHRLLGEYARAEVELLGWIDKYNPVGGRADLIIRRQDTGISIMDGKNAKSKGKYTDPDQLRWYAMLFYLAYREMPDRVGFNYFRYPHGTPMVDPKTKEPVLDEATNQPLIEQGVDWVPFTKDDLKGLAHRAVVARKGMDKEKFPANPVPKVCQWCDYATVCPERIAQKEKNSRGRRKNKKKVDAIEGEGGFTDFNL